jgi:hypothetical protein
MHISDVVRLPSYKFGLPPSARLKQPKTVMAALPPATGERAASAPGAVGKELGSTSRMCMPGPSTPRSASSRSSWLHARR